MDVNYYLGVKDGEKPLDRLVTDGGFCAIFRTIACIGDSLSSGEFESKCSDGTKGYHDMFEYSWGQFLGRSCGSTVYNFSRGGMTAKQYIEGFADANEFWSRNKLAQAYILALGVNDLSGGDDNLGCISDVNFNDYRKNAKTFAGYYAQIIQRIKELQPRAKIFLVTIPKGNLVTEERKKAHRDLLERLTQKFTNTYLIDLYTYSPVQDEKFTEVFWHGHMTATGYIMMAKMIESYIDYIIRQNPQEFKQVGFIGTDLYFEKEQ